LGRAAEQKPPEKIDSQHKTSAWGKESLAKRTFFSSLLVAVVSSNRTLPFRVFAALLAGMIALAANIALLSIASAAGICTAHGGLFLLFTRIIHRVAPSRSFVDGWKIFAPPVSQAVFHIVTGLVMAIFYALVLEPKLPGRPFFKGVAYGTS
jgi:energy-converting hydrogenase Eha subunit C